MTGEEEEAEEWEEGAEEEARSGPPHCCFTLIW